MTLTKHKILARRSLGGTVDESWIEWAAQMLATGYDSPNLITLAGESKPYNSHELRVLADNVFAELGWDWSDQEQVMKAYARELLEEMLAGESTIGDTLHKLSDLYLELGYVHYLSDFNYLHHAYSDFMQGATITYYWDTTPEEFESALNTYCQKWLVNPDYREADAPQKQAPSSNKDTHHEKVTSVPKFKGLIEKDAVWIIVIVFSLLLLANLLIEKGILGPDPSHAPGGFPPPGIQFLF